MARETERPSAAWNVPTSGAREIIAAAIDTDGTTGSCTWTTSKSFSSSQRRVRVIVVGLTEMLATEPLKGTDTEEPADVIHSGRSRDVDGVRTRTSWPRERSLSARSRMWKPTPPGTSHE